MAFIDRVEQNALERNPQPEGFAFYRWSCMPHQGPTLYYEVSGAIAPLLKSGPNKGRHNWKRMDKATKRTFIIPVADQDAWDRRWSETTGKCLNCSGEGKTLARCGVNIPTEYRECFKCKGTGKA